MEKILRLFKESSLYDACLQMLNHLQVSVNEGISPLQRKVLTH